MLDEQQAAPGLRIRRISQSARQGRYRAQGVGHDGCVHASVRPTVMPPAPLDESSHPNSANRLAAMAEHRGSGSIHQAADLAGS